MPADDFPPSLQESILAALIFDERAGAAIAVQVQPRQFDETYRDIAEKVLDYRRKYHKAPGRTHLDDLFGHVLVNNRAPKLRRLLFGLVDLADNLNKDYIVAQTQHFVRQQQIKASLIEANSRFEQGGENTAEDIEQIFSGALRNRAQTIDPGIFLNDSTRSLAFMNRDEGSYYRIGVDQLDRMGVGIFPKQMLLFIGPKNIGKTWFCVHCGKQVLAQRGKVLHVSLEFAKELTVERYYQSIWGAATRPDKYDKTFLEFDRLGRLLGWKTRATAPKWHWRQPGARRELAKRIQSWGTRLGRLVVVDFPSGRLTCAQLEAHLDYLESEHNFVPNVLIVDYPKLMKLDSKNMRIDLGQTVVDLRGLCVARNMAGIFPHQGNRSSLDARQVTSKMAGEDISVVQTADTVLTQSRSKREEERGLARLYLEYARGSKANTEMIITQSYATGQYVLQSALMERRYWERWEELGGVGSRGEDDE